MSDGEPDVDALASRRVGQLARPCCTTRHRTMTPTVLLDIGLIASIRRAVSVPLVLHGSSGVPDRDLAAAIRGRNDEDQYRDSAEQGIHRPPSAIAWPADAAMVDPRRYGSERGATRSRRRLPGCSA